VKNNSNLANFFWHGDLTNYENICISSFVEHGFEVNVWSYQNLKLPTGANLKDAREILPIEHLTAYTQNKQEKNLAAFSDVFRFTMLHKVGGWWFDTDCVCLKPVDDFIKLAENKKVVAGKENDQWVACGAIFFEDDNISKLFLDELQKRCIENNNKFKGWGWIGPKLFTEVVQRNNLFDQMCSPDTFYPVSWKDYLFLFQPDKLEVINNMCSNAYTCHLWNELFRRDGIDKSQFPLENSWLDFLYKKYIK
jgi:hypothetical protein